MTTNKKDEPIDEREARARETSKHFDTLKERAMRVILTGEDDRILSRTTLGAFLNDNPDIVIGADDIKQAIDAQGYWVFDGGAGGAFRLIWDDETELTAEELRVICGDLKSALLQVFEELGKHPRFEVSDLRLKVIKGAIDRSNGIS